MALCLQSAATGPSVATLDLSDCRPVMEMPQVHILRIPTHVWTCWPFLAQMEKFSLSSTLLNLWTLFIHVLTSVTPKNLFLQRLKHPLPKLFDQTHKKKQASPNWSWHWYTPYVFMNLKKGYLKFLFVDIFAKYGVIEDRWVCGLFCCSFPHFEATIKKFQMIQLNGHITYKKNKYIKKHFLTVSSFSFSVSALHVQVNCLTWNPLGPQGPALRAKLLCPTSFGKSHRGHAAPQPHHGLRQASLTPSPPLPGEAIRWVCLKAGVAHTPLVSTQFLFIRNSDVKLSDTSSLSFYWK